MTWLRTPRRLWPILERTGNRATAGSARGAYGLPPMPAQRERARLVSSAAPRSWRVTSRIRRNDPQPRERGSSCPGRLQRIPLAVLQ